MNLKKEEDPKREKLEDRKEVLKLLPMTKKELEKIKIIDYSVNITNEILPSIQQKYEHTQKKKKKERKSLNKDRHYYKQNRELIKQKAKKKYKEKMKNRHYRFNYLAKQREYNRRRKSNCCIKIERLLYPINPFKNDDKIVIVFDGC